MTRLTATRITRKLAPGLHGDGGGLYLRVKPSGAKSWILRVQYLGRRQDIGLGSLLDLDLEEARERAAYLRRQVRRGVDVRAERKSGKAKPLTFKQAYELALAEMEKSWSDRTRDSFTGAMENHALPALGKRWVSEIEAGDMIAALEPIWMAKPQTARKVRQGIRQVLTFCKARGWRASPVPMPDEIRSGLARQPKSVHHAAMPWREVPALFASQWAAPPAPTRLALLFVILTAARQGEVRSARWEHIDLERREWVRPAELLKTRRDHVVQLSAAAIAVLDRAAALYGKDGLIFPSIRKRAQLTDPAIPKVLREAGRTETVHGFRSTFRDWAAEERADLPGEVAEMALAHEVGSAIERAYRRTRLVEMQRDLLESWGRFVAPMIGVADHD